MTSEKLEVFISDNEELPTDMSKKIKVIELPVFTEDDKKKVQGVVEKIDNFMSNSASYKAEFEKLGQSLKELEGMRTEEKRMVMLFARTVQSIEAIGQSLVDMKSGMRDMINDRVGLTETKLEEKLYSLDSTISYLKGLIIDMAEKPRGSDAAMLSAVNEKFDSYNAAVSSRLDTFFDQTADALGTANGRLDMLSGQTTESLININARLDAMRRDIQSAKKVRQTIKITMPATALEMLDEAKKKIRSKRVPRKSQEDKKRIMREIDGLRERALDVFIFSVMGAKTVAVSAITKEVPASETRVKKRVNHLVAAGKIRKTKKGRFFVYSVV